MLVVVGLWLLVWLLVVGWVVIGDWWVPCMIVAQPEERAVLKAARMGRKACAKAPILKGADSLYIEGPSRRADQREHPP